MQIKEQLKNLMANCFGSRTASYSIWAYWLLEHTGHVGVGVSVGVGDGVCEGAGTLSNGVRQGTVSGVDGEVDAEGIGGCRCRLSPPPPPPPHADNVIPMVTMTQQQDQECASLASFLLSSGEERNQSQRTNDCSDRIPGKRAGFVLSGLTPRVKNLPVAGS